MLLNKELVIGGDFSSWPGDNPAGWGVTGEVGTDPEVSEVGPGEGHGGVGAGMCNIFTTAGGGTYAYITQTISYVIGRKCRLSMNINRIITGKLRVFDNAPAQWPLKLYDSTGIKAFTFVPTKTSSIIYVSGEGGIAVNITFDDVSIRADIPAELSRTGCHFASHQGM